MQESSKTIKSEDTKVLYIQKMKRNPENQLQTKCTKNILWSCEDSKYKPFLKPLKTGSETEVKSKRLY